MDASTQTDFDSETNDRNDSEIVDKNGDMDDSYDQS